MRNPNTLLHDCLLGCIFKARDSQCCCTGHIISPAVRRQCVCADALRLTRCWGQVWPLFCYCSAAFCIFLTDWLAQYCLKTRLCSCCWIRPLPQVKKNWNEFVSIAEDVGYLAGYFIKAPLWLDVTHQWLHRQTCYLTQYNWFKFKKKTLCVGVNRITSRLMCCYGGSVSLHLMDSLVSDYQTEMRCYDVCSVTSVLIHTLVRSSRRRNHLTHLCWLHMQQQSMRYKPADSVKHNCISFCQT